MGEHTRQLQATFMLPMERLTATHDRLNIFESDLRLHAVRSPCSEHHFPTDNLPCCIHLALTKPLMDINISAVNSDNYGVGSKKNRIEHTTMGYVTR
jgi:hypothetical protein